MLQAKGGGKSSAITGSPRWEGFLSLRKTRTGSNGIRGGEERMGQDAVKKSGPRSVSPSQKTTGVCLLFQREKREAEHLIAAERRRDGLLGHQGRAHFSFEETKTEGNHLDEKQTEGGKTPPGKGRKGKILAELRH